jgi:hypothetical protein
VAAGYDSVKLAGFSRGIVNANTNPLLYPQDALLSGENVDLRNAGLATRKGYTLNSTLVEPVIIAPDEVAITQRLFPELDGRNWLTAVYDSVNDRALLFAGRDDSATYNDVWAYDCALHTISQLTCTGDTPPEMYGHAAVYLGGYMYVFGGDTSGTIASWRLNCTSLVWEELAPIPNGGTVLVGCSACVHGGLVYVFGGSVTGASSGVRNGLYRYTPGTDSWETLKVAESGSGRTPDTIWKHSAVDIGDDMLIWGGDPYDSTETASAWYYNYDADTFTEVDLGSQTVPAELLYPARRGHAAVWHPDLDLMIRACGGTSETAGLNDVVSFDTATYEWVILSPLAGSDEIPQRQLCGYCYDSTRGLVLLFGGDNSGGILFDCIEIDASGDPEPVTDRVEFLTQVRFPTLSSKYLIAQVTHPTNGSRIYVSDTELPSEAVTFNEIYDLGTGAGVISVAALNDRAVITEGFAKPPLVFLGCQQADGSDWAVPKQALATVNGTDYYDMTSELCDPDVDTTADFGAFPSTGYLYLCFDVPTTEGIYFSVGTPNAVTTSATVERFTSGAWTGIGVTDNTASAGKPLAVSGTITWAACDTDYQEIAELAGFWLRIRWGATLSAGTTLARALFSAPCQPLQSIGSGTPDHPLSFIYHDVSEASEKDWTVEVSDEDSLTSARLSTKGTGGETVVPMGSGDAIYIAGLTRFNAIRMVPAKDNNNANAAVLSVQYWNGSAWTTVSGLSDGTSSGGKTFRQTGKISWTLPTNWKQSRGLNRAYPMGYWVRLTVSASLSTRVYIEECGLYPVQEDLKKHKYALTLRDRIVLASRPDAPDQVDISRALEEYGWTGSDSFSLRVGGQGGLVCGVTAYNQGWLGKSDEIYMLNGYSPATFASERAETGGQAPINNRVIVPGPVAESDAKVKQGWYYLTLMGAYHFTGLQTYSLSDKLSWWDETSTNLPRIDLDNLHIACGIYWPERSWVIWSVPMITQEGQLEQTTNNRLIIYDLTLGAFLPPFTIAAASLCVARHHNASAPDSLGGRGIYFGSLDGKMYRLFAGDSDNGTAISCSVRTGHLHFSLPDWEKAVHSLRAFGKLTDSPVIIDGYVDGEATVRDGNSVTFSGLTGIGSKAFSQEYTPQNLQGTTFQFVLSWTGPGEIYGLEMKVPQVRERPRTG